MSGPMYNSPSVPMRLSSRNSYYFTAPASLTHRTLFQAASTRIIVAPERSRQGAAFMADERTEKGKAIDLAMSQIEKQFGKGSIMKLGSKGAVVPIAVISTGAISFDAALGIGGFPRGRVVEIFGPESSGKTTIALQVIGEAQKQGGMAAFVDAEHALDPIYAAKLGVDVDNLLVSQPDHGEQALEITEALVRSNAIEVRSEEHTSELQSLRHLVCRLLLEKT